eukprot:2115318-Rhodomonas_salina.2
MPRESVWLDDERESASGCSKSGAHRRVFRLRVKRESAGMHTFALRELRGRRATDSTRQTDTQTDTQTDRHTHTATPRQHDTPAPGIAQRGAESAEREGRAVT